MENIKTKIFILNLKSNSVHLDTLSRSYSNSKNVELEAFRNAKDVQNSLRSLGTNKAVFLFKVETKQQFTEALSILKSRCKQIYSGDIKPICIIDFNNKKAETYLSKFGCKIQIDNKVTQKAFALKLDLAVKSLIPKQNSSDFNGISQKEESYNRSFEEKNDLSEEIDKEVEDMLFDLGESLESNESYGGVLNFNQEIKKSKFSASLVEEDNPELVNYIKESGDLGKINLQNGRVEISLANDSSNDLYCSIDNFEADKITLEMKGIVNIQDGDKINISVKFIYNKCKVEIELDGVVSETELSESIDGSSFVSVSLSQFEEEKLDYFMSLYEQRQKSINDFMELAKGY
jgi:hypothetical protein